MVTVKGVMQGFRSLYHQGFARIAACTLPVVLADSQASLHAILSVARNCSAQGVAAVVFPELALTGYTLDDLRFQDVVLEAAEVALKKLVEATTDLMTVVVVGVPLRRGDLLYNCAAVVHRGRLLGVVPKSYLPRYREFYEPRHFTSGLGSTGVIRLWGTDVPFGADLLFEAEDIAGLTLGVEICEDLWVASPPSGALAMAGASVILNPSASPVTIGRAEDRTLLCNAQSMRTLTAYAYAAAGEGESTTDLAWDGQISIHEAGKVLARSDRFPRGERVIVADVDLELLRQERMRTGQFGMGGERFRRLGFVLAPPLTDLGLKRDVARFPFVPSESEHLKRDCYEAWTIQVSALRQRLVASRAQRMVIGVSGGLDSTLALLVAARAADELGWPRTHVLAYTMPGFATGTESRGLAHELMDALGVESNELDIRPAAETMLQGIGHPYSRGEAVHDITFENVQAGLRTDFLFRLANLRNGIVIGTGDLSELALGWCTYGVGDQMSHYNVNAGMPKTLIQHVIRWFARQEDVEGRIASVLESIVSAEISPELVPDSGQGVQSTEQIIGPYALQDFTLYYVLRHGFRPSRIAYLAERAWSDPKCGVWPQNYPQDRRTAYDLSDIRHWMEIFLSRFFGTSQFKRSAMPNGPKLVAGGSLSPRGDWRAPSDGNARAWLEELRKNVPE
ncbi:NAD(+) synthase [Gluconobacter wancherniae NBRC 103581]|uniref:Glutamine-dependent NAD(+) synthetase n=2 Tax=Gluconobacter wancherniae TaxID=1307955 RepID=A0A511B1V6_9PROT|nr:NAD synthetase [Gluconobacter wancherniae NBRC 103581]GEK94404.1 NAD(+) synthase [Gluconobacter wancherniae NBRC 103581]